MDQHTFQRLRDSFEHQVDALPQGFSKWTLAEVARESGLKTCGICAIVDEVIVVMPDAPTQLLHRYAGSGACVTLPLCPECFEQGVPEEELDPDFHCSSCGFRNREMDDEDVDEDVDDEDV